MFFKLTVIIKPLGLGNDRFEFDLKQNESVIHIELQKIPIEELKKHHVAGDLRCIAIVERKVSDNSQDLFKSLTTEVPKGIKPLIDEVGKELQMGFVNLLRISDGDGDFQVYIILCVSVIR